MFIPIAATWDQSLGWGYGAGWMVHLSPHYFLFKTCAPKANIEPLNAICCNGTLIATLGKQFLKGKQNKGLINK